MTIFAQVYVDEDVDVLVATLLLARGLIQQQQDQREC